MEKKQNCVIWFHSIYKKDNMYKFIPRGVKTRFDTSNYALDKSLPKNVIGLMKY